jgi:peptidoglycan/xylan/chitin deacetylase (PgdA/CDA1 family)
MSAIAQEASTPRWRPKPLVAGSVGLHGIAALGALFGPEAWPWAVGAVAANHVVLGAISMWPRSTLFGPNISRLPPAAIARGEIALTFDDGPDPEVTPRVLDLLEAHGVHATFFCIAQRVARHPDLCREIVRRGHAVENHSLGHRTTFALLGVGGIRREIAQAQRMLAEQSGREPRFFRPPAGFRNPMLDPVLHETGLRLVTWTRRAFDTRRGDAAHIARRLAQGLAAGDILLLHDGHCARNDAGTAVVLEALPLVLDAVGLRPVTLAQAIDS